MKSKLLIAAGAAALLGSMAVAQGYGGSSTPAPAKETTSEQTPSQQTPAADSAGTGGPDQAGYEDAGERG